jgi:hypothetical protein
MTPAERVVVEAAVRWAADHDHHEMEDIPLLEAVDTLLVERNGPALEVQEITWSQVVEGDQLYRAANGAAAPVGAPGGRWMEVTRSGPLVQTGRMRINVKGIPQPIQPHADRMVVVKRGATGQAADVICSLVWSGASTPVPPEAGPVVPIDAHNPAADPEAAAPELEDESDD